MIQQSSVVVQLTPQLVEVNSVVAQGPAGQPGETGATGTFAAQANNTITGNISGISAIPVGLTTAQVDTLLGLGTAAYTAATAYDASGAAATALASAKTYYTGTALQIDVTSGAISIDSGYVGQASITTLGTITTGVWHGTRLAASYIPTDTAYVDAANDWSTAQLPSAMGTIDLGSTTANWRNLYLGGATYYQEITSASLSGNRTFTTPDANSNSVVPSSAGSHQWANGISSAGVVSYAQPAFTDVSGTASTGQIPNLAATILTSGVVNTAQLGSGSATASTFLDGANAWRGLTGADIPSTRSGSLVALAASSNAVISNLAGLSTGTAKLTIYDNQGNIVDYVLYNGTIQQQDTNATYSASTSASPSPASLSVIIALNAGVLKIYTGASWSGFSWNFTLDLFS